MTFGTILKGLRKEAKISQQELADKLNISRSAIGMYENNERSANDETKELIADLFNVDMNFLYGRTQIKNSYAKDAERHISIKTISNKEETKKEPLLKWHENYVFDDVYDAMTYLNAFEQEFGQLKAFGGIFYEEMTGKEIIEHAQEVLRLQSLIANSKKD